MKRPQPEQTSTGDITGPSYAFLCNVRSQVILDQFVSQYLIGHAVSDDVSLTVNGATVSSWKSVRITRGMERTPDDFDISMTERFPDTTTVVVTEGNPCVVKIGEDRLSPDTLTV
ncbi:hypothetical protein QF001_003089 [Paraburkholderia youngii]|uniref:phage baseplate assembly protein n=1 Tax=Paraburkholderia youngii TaxID=2782701 RepID=UPI003D224F60